MGPGGGGHFAKLWEELQLTPEQRQKIQAKLGAQMKARQGTMKAQMAAHEKHLAAIATAFEAEKFDAKTAGVGGKGADMVKAMIDSRIAFVEAVFDVLTPEQRAKFAAHLKAHTDSEADDD
jgi:Spy/CpxP family protein refolding chaperone